MREKCVRCHQTREFGSSFEGVPTCKECELKLIEARLAHMPKIEGAPPPLTCPRDGQPLLGSLVLGMMVDRCPECGGIWFDTLEVEFLKRTLEEHGGGHQPTLNALVNFIAKDLD